ncbi:MAG: hypothetical protein KJO67_02240 [Silicimonas sp.]|nr:hypothetical protein [Silicimonas sp.]
MELQKAKRKSLNLVGANSPVPVEFGFEDEHPAVSLPFGLKVCGQQFVGSRISMTAIHVVARDEVFLIKGSKHAARIQFDFQNFSVSIYPEVVVVGERGDELVLKFADPAGDHVAQLRFVMNSFIAGDFVTLGAVMAYSGPTKPKEEKKNVEQNWKERYRSIVVAAVSAGLIIAAAFGLYSRYTTGIELHPVLIERVGQPMQATTAGQIAYLNTDAPKGEVLFSINANSGDVLNFKMPCDCEIVLSQGVREGVTVLPTDVILTILVNNVDLSIQALMSVEGLARAMKGDRVYLDLTDGRSIPVQVIAGSGANSASLKGELFVPVQLVAEDGVLTEADIGKYGQLRLTKPGFWN